MEQGIPAAVDPVASLAIDPGSVAAHWNAKSRSSANWWTSKRVMREYNKRVCGHPHTSPVGGIGALIRQRAGGTVDTAISIGCGNGGKEIELLRSGVVHHVTGYDLSPVRIDAARKRAQELGVGERADFRVGDAFKEARPGYGMVFWASALHHMPDTADAIRWSRSLLQPGGLFAMDEYVGPNQFQLPDPDFAWLNRVRGAMPARMFRQADRPDLPRELTPASLMAVCRKDPSEAFDSAAILGGVRATFPMAEIRPLGGLLFFLALNGLYGGFDYGSDVDNALLDMMLMMDGEDVQRRPDATLYAAAIASA